jgi:hypothetical protein
MMQVPDINAAIIDFANICANKIEKAMASNPRRRSAERERIQKVERSSFACVVGHTDREGALPIKATRAKLSYPCVCACL